MAKFCYKFPLADSASMIQNYGLCKLAPVIFQESTIFEITLDHGSFEG